VSTAVFGVNAVVLDPLGRVLLARRDAPPIWNLPGGKPEPGEAPWHAAVRETREEVGIDVEVVRLTGVYDRAPAGRSVLVFLCRRVAGTPTTGAEATEVAWFPVDGLPTDINPYQPQRIRDALVGERAVLRSQPGPSVRELFPDV
jgi:8-oxo-dGTP diphosphatase